MMNKKRAHWKEIKKEFLTKIPSGFKIDVDWGNEDTEYYFPSIKVDDYIISSQCSFEHDTPYGLSFKGAELNSHMYGISIDEDDLHSLLSDWKTLASGLKKDAEYAKSLYEVKLQIENTMNDVTYSSVLRLINKNKLKETMKNVYEITEFIENNRLI